MTTETEEGASVARSVHLDAPVIRGGIRGVSNSASSVISGGSAGCPCFEGACSAPSPLRPGPGTAKKTISEMVKNRNVLNLTRLRAHEHWGTGATGCGCILIPARIYTIQKADNFPGGFKKGARNSFRQQDPRPYRNKLVTIQVQMKRSPSPRPLPKERENSYQRWGSAHCFGTWPRAAIGCSLSWGRGLG